MAVGSLVAPIPTACLHTCLRALLVGDPHSISWGRLAPRDWQALLDTADRHGVLPLVYTRLHAAGVLPLVPLPAADRARAAYYRSTAQNTLIYHILTHLATAAQHPLIVLKGAALAVTVYPQVGVRPMSDLDLLVDERDLPRLLATLHAMDYASETPEVLPAYIEQHHYHHSMVHTRHALPQVELHWRLISSANDVRSPPTAWFWQHTCPLRLPTATPTPAVVMLDPTAHVLYLAAHLMLQHGEQELRLIWLYDLHLLLSSAPVAWGTLLRVAYRYHWAAALSMALDATRQWFATPIPADVLAMLASVPDPAGRTLVKRQVGRVGTRTHDLWTIVASMPWRERAAFLRGQLLPTRHYLRWRYDLPLPPALDLLYYPYRWYDIACDAVLTTRLLLREQRARASTHDQ